MTWQIDALSNRDREALGSLVGRLMAEPSLRVQRIVLYGSKARHEDTPESDIDVLVVTADDRWLLKDRISTIGARVVLDYDVLFSLMVVSQARWDWMQHIRHPFYRSVAVDGIDITAVRELA